MTTIVATAECPNCKWKLFETFQSEQEVIDLVHAANKTVDPMLLEHIKSHKSISLLLSEAAKEVPMSQDSHKGFRGSFGLKYQEIK